jgi:hypothetical protein
MIRFSKFLEEKYVTINDIVEYDDDHDENDSSKKTKNEKKRKKCKSKYNYNNLVTYMQQVSGIQ